MGRLGTLLAGWGTPRKVLVSAVAAILVVVAVALPLTLGSSGHARSTFPGGVSPGTAPESGLPLSPSSSGPTSTTATSDSRSTTTIRTSSPSGSAGQTSGHSTKGPTTPQTAPPDTVLGSGPFSWHQQTLPAGTPALGSISCPNSVDCWAVGGTTVIKTTDSGRTWRTEPTGITFGSNDQLDGISCVDSQTCWAISAAERAFHTTDGGASWTEQSVGANKSTGFCCVFAAIDCINQSDCWIVGQGNGWIAYTTDGGNDWSITAICGPCQFYGISCPTSSTCWASGTYVPNGSKITDVRPMIYGTANGGRSWSAQTLPPIAVNNYGHMFGISCANAEDCTAVGDLNTTPGGILSTTNGGASWTETNAPSGGGYGVSVSCTADNQCWAVGGAGVITRPGTTASWNFDLPANGYRFTSIDCIQPGYCWTAGTGNSTAPNPPPVALFARTTS